MKTSEILKYLKERRQHFEDGRDVRERVCEPNAPSLHYLDGIIDGLREAINLLEEGELL